MSEFFQSVADWFTEERVMMVVRVSLVVIFGFVFAKILGSLTRRGMGRVTSNHVALLFQRVVFYGVLAIALTSVLHEFGFDLSVLLGAAGILTVAIGFASQTSMSNLISGLFLLVERPFVVGDAVRISDVTGEVLSIDLLSLKVRTFDNLFVRIPNSTVINSQLTNLTHFPIRRVDVQIGVAYKEDLDRVQAVLRDLADRNPLCMDEPAPLYILQGFGDSAINIQFSVWGTRENYLALRNSLQTEIKRTFDELGIEIPYPHHSVYTGAITEPFPIRLVGHESDDSLAKSTP